ncbi:hypothetical protein H5410_054500, partial [Solanum commersonii]
MEPIGPHGQNNPFSSSNKLRSSYESSWPSRLNWPIFKGKRAPKQTFPMELVGPHSQNAIFNVKRTLEQ